VIHETDPDETSILEAAGLAAYFSKARDSSSVPVDYTEVRHVKKPNGSKPGFVIYFSGLERETQGTMEAGSDAPCKASQHLTEDQ